MQDGWELVTQMPEERSGLACGIVETAQGTELLITGAGVRIRNYISLR